MSRSRLNLLSYENRTTSRAAPAFFAVFVGVQLAVLLAFIRYCFRPTWDQHMDAGWGAIVLTCLVCSVVLCFGEFLFHRYLSARRDGAIPPQRVQQSPEAPPADLHPVRRGLGDRAQRLSDAAMADFLARPRGLQTAALDGEEALTIPGLRAAHSAADRAARRPTGPGRQQPSWCPRRRCSN